MGQVKAVPEGYTTITPFMNIKNAAEALAFYGKAFGAEVVRQHNTPDGKIGIAICKIGNSMVHISDAIKDPETTSGTHLSVENADAWWQRAVDAGCDVRMPLQDTPWGSRFGTLTDKFGNRWAISQQVEDVSPAEAERRMAELAQRSK
jgi:PhnB protein